MQADLMWAAGFYEGEGSITAVGHALFLTIGQVDREPLDRFASVVGTGTIHLNRGGTIHTYRSYGLEAQRVAMSLWPVLSTRRQDQVLRALLRYASRRVRDPLRCARGHLYSIHGTYEPPGGTRECRRCRDDRRRGPLNPITLPTAIEARLGIREYHPLPLQPDGRSYRPLVQT